MDKNCTSCHSNGTPSANQSGLVLTADVAYEQLRDANPRNAAAFSDGLVRVSTAKGETATGKSFLLQKIDNRDETSHTHTHNATYGSMMPISSRLTHGQIEFVEQWIAAGAPKEGKVVDTAVLNDTTITTDEFEPLAAPAEGKGKQFHLTDIDVQPDSEREIFSYQKLNNANEVFVNRIQVEMRSGSHHFLIYGYPEGFNKTILDAQLTAAGLGALAPAIEFPPKENAYRDLYTGNSVVNPTTGALRANFDNRVLALMSFQNFISGTQWPSMDYQFPKGTALRLPANMAFELNSHYVNYTPVGQTPSVKHGEVYANLYYTEAAAVEHEVKMLQLNNRDILLPANSTKTLTKDYIFDDSYNFDKELTVIQMFSHAHSRMKNFKVKVIGGAKQGNTQLTDGAIVYEENDWQHPVIKRFDAVEGADSAKALVFAKGQGLKLETTYQNDTAMPISFGALSENEMMILFGYYYTDKKPVANQ